MAIKRRTFLKTLAAFSASQLAPPAFASLDLELIMGASRLDENNYAVSAVNLDGRLQWQTALPARGHDIALHPKQNIGVAVARRPGQFLVVFDTATGAVKQKISVDKNTKLNGHAIWVGRHLVVSASDLETSTMRLLRYELVNNSLKLNDDHNFDYIGPHQMALFGEDIYVAIGGLKTNEREVTNKDNFESLLLNLNAETLQVKNAYPAITQHISLRHLAINARGNVFVAGQTQGAPEDSENLLFELKDNRLQAFNEPAQLWPKLKGYLGSIQCINENIIVTSPRAHWLGSFNSTSLLLEDQLFAHDICALANSTKGLVAGTGTGKLFIGEKMVNSYVSWDNHFQVVKIFD